MPVDPCDNQVEAPNEVDNNFVAVKLIFDISSPLRVANEIHFLTLLR